MLELRPQPSSTENKSKSTPKPCALQDCTACIDVRDTEPCHRILKVLLRDTYFQAAKSGQPTRPHWSNGVKCCCACSSEIDSSRCAKTYCQQSWQIRLNNLSMHMPGRLPVDVSMHLMQACRTGPLHSDQISTYGLRRQGAKPSRVCRKR